MIDSSTVHVGGNSILRLHPLSGKRWPSLYEGGGGEVAAIFVGLMIYSSSPLRSPFRPPSPASASPPPPPATLHFLHTHGQVTSKGQHVRPEGTSVTQ